MPLVQVQVLQLTSNNMLTWVHAELNSMPLVHTLGAPAEQRQAVQNFPAPS